MRIYPLGGLGNQLFTYGLGLRLSTELGLPLESDCRAFLTDHQRKYELSSFSNSITTEICSHKPWNLPVAGRLMGRLKGLAMPPTWRNVDDEDGWQSTVSRLSSQSPVPRRVRLHGYFQDFQAFSNYREVLRRQTREIVAPSDKYLRLLAQLSEQNFISVHVRMGDFRDSPGQNILENRYYRKALELAIELGGPRQVIVFSDEPQQARQMSSLQHLEDESFLGLKGSESLSGTGDGLCAIETLNLMSRATVAVCANSTFSMWAAWLSRHNNDRVIVPRPFSKKVPRDERFLVPADWLSVGD